MLLDNKKVDYGIVHKIQPFWFLKSYLDLVPRRGPGTRSGIKSRSGGPKMVAFARDSAAGEWGGNGTQPEAGGERPATEWAVPFFKLDE